MSYFEQPPVSYEVYKPKILDAIAQKFCTLPQIKKYAGIERSFDVSDLLTWMLDNKEIVRLENANLTAYFLPEKVSVKFWSNGDGRVGVEYSEKAVEKIAEKTSGKKFIEVSEADVEFHASKAEGRKLMEIQRQVASNLGLGLSTLMKKFKDFPELKAAFERGRKTYHANHKPEIIPTGGQPKPPKKRKANPNFTRENFYNWGKKGFGSKEIAESLGITYQSVNTFLRWNREMQDALNSGLNNQTDEPLAHNEIAEMESQNPYSNPDEQAQPETCHKTGCANSIPNSEFYYCSDDCMLDDTITNPAKAEIPEVKTEKGFTPAFPDDKVEIQRNESIEREKPPVEAVEPSDTILNTFEELNPNFRIQPVMVELKSSEPSETVSFGSAGQIELFADLNLFLMDETSREFLNKLITDIQRFKEDQRLKDW